MTFDQLANSYQSAIVLREPNQAPGAVQLSTTGTTPATTSATTSTTPATSNSRQVQPFTAATFTSRPDRKNQASFRNGKRFNRYWSRRRGNRRYRNDLQ
jgi:hypothetical protein